MRQREEGRTKQVIIVSIVAFLMVSSIIGFLYTGSADTIREYGYKFVKRQNMWSTAINQKEALFSFLPSEVADIQVSPEIISKMASTFEVDATYDYNSTLAEAIAGVVYEMAQVFDFNFGKFMRLGLTANVTSSVSVIACSSASQAVPVLYFKASNETKVYLQENCIIAEAKDSSDVARIKDRLFYGLFGIIR